MTLMEASDGAVLEAELEYVIHLQNDDHWSDEEIKTLQVWVAEDGRLTGQPAALAYAAQPVPLASIPFCSRHDAEQFICDSFARRVVCERRQSLLILWKAPP